MAIKPDAALTLLLDECRKGSRISAIRAIDLLRQAIRETNELPRDPRVELTGCNGALDVFKPAVIPMSREEIIAHVRQIPAVTQEQAEQQADRLLSDRIVINSTYQVNISDVPTDQHGFTGMRIVHLSIKRRDKAPIHDWRDLQAIKAQLMGPDVEAIEIYPAAERTVDTSNQYHLWCVMNPLGKPHPVIPVGWMEGLTLDGDILAARQRPPA